MRKSRPKRGADPLSVDTSERRRSTQLILMMRGLRSLAYGLLALVAFAPTFPIAAALLLLRQALSQMDIPTRQAYTMALVAPQERTAAASVTSLARSLGASTSPVFSGLLLEGPLLIVGFPFILAGTLKVAYDLAVWAVFRRVHLQEEEDHSIQTANHVQPPAHPPSQEAEASPEHERRLNP